MMGCGIYSRSRRSDVRETIPKRRGVISDDTWIMEIVHRKRRGINSLIACA